MTQDNQSAEQPRKTGADVAHFFRALGRAGADGMPMPMEVNTSPQYGVIQVRFEDDAIGDLDAWVSWIGGKAVHNDYTHRAGYDRAWHSYGTDYRGGVNPSWLGWELHLWCSVDGPHPGDGKVPEAVAAPDAYAVDEPEDVPSIEDVPPRGTDAAEETVPKPAGVEGLAHERGGDWHTQPSGEQPIVEPTLTFEAVEGGGIRRWRLSGPEGTVLFEVAEALGIVSPSVFLLPPGGSEHEREALIGGVARKLYRDWQAAQGDEQVIARRLESWYGEHLASGHMGELWEPSAREVDAEADRAGFAALADERANGGA